MSSLNYLEYALLHITLNSHHEFKYISEKSHTKGKYYVLLILREKIREVNYIKFLLSLVPNLNNNEKKKKK